MTRALDLALLILAAPAHAGDNAPGAHLWPEEPAYIVWIDAAPLFPLWRRCSLDTPCSVPYDREPDPAPVPLPWSGALLLGAFGALALLGWVKR